MVKKTSKWGKLAVTIYKWHGTEGLYVKKEKSYAFCVRPEPAFISCCDESLMWFGLRYE